MSSKDWTPNEKDAWHLLQLAESGRFEEQIAQFIASMVISGDVQTSDLMHYLGRIWSRVGELLSPDFEHQIWPHLTPGGGQGIELEHPDTRRMEAVLEGLQDLDDESAIEFIIGFLEEDGYIDRGWGDNRRLAREQAKIEEVERETTRVMLITNQIDNPGWLVALQIGLSDAFRLYIWDGSFYNIVSGNYGPDELGRCDVVDVDINDLSEAQNMLNLQDVLKKA